MVSLNSLLIGFYALLSYSYSQRHTYLTLGSWKRDIGAAAPMSLPRGCTKTEKKRQIFLFSKPTVSWGSANEWEFLPSICFSNTNSTHTYLCLLFAVNDIQGTGGVALFCEKNCLLARRIPFLYLRCKASTVFLGAEHSLPLRAEATWARWDAISDALDWIRLDHVASHCISDDICNIMNSITI